MHFIEWEKGDFSAFQKHKTTEKPNISSITTLRTCFVPQKKKKTRTYICFLGKRKALISLLKKKKSHGFPFNHSGPARPAATGGGLKTSIVADSVLCFGLKCTSGSWYSAATATSYASSVVKRITHDSQPPDSSGRLFLCVSPAINVYCVAGEEEESDVASAPCCIGTGAASSFSVHAKEKLGTGTSRPRTHKVRFACKDSKASSMVVRGKCGHCWISLTCTE